MHSVLFDHLLERDGVDSQCGVMQECFDGHSRRCASQFAPDQITFMRIICLSSLLHGTESTMSSSRTRGLMNLLFFRLWSMSSKEKEVVLHVTKAISCHNLQTRLRIYLRLAAGTSIMEITVWLGVLIFAHTAFADNAVTASWNGVYDEMLGRSNFSSWNVSRGQDPRYLNDLVQLMTDMLLAYLAFCSMFPVPISASLILLVPVTICVQVRCPVATFPFFVSRFMQIADNVSLTSDLLLHAAKCHSSPPTQPYRRKFLSAGDFCGVLCTVATQRGLSPQLPHGLLEKRSAKTELLAPGSWQCTLQSSTRSHDCLSPKNFGTHAYPGGC